MAGFDRTNLGIQAARRLRRRRGDA